jgi:hypothetical protein
VTRTRHTQPVQQALFRPSNHGGKRRGAGRKSEASRPGRRHATRPAFREEHPIHVVLRVEPSVGSLRRRNMYRAIRAATLTTALRGRVRIVHLSLQRTHLHMLVEAANREALARGLQGFQISAARYINRALAEQAIRSEQCWGAARSEVPRCELARRRGNTACRRGRVFSARYYAEYITSPTQAHRALRYVLLNWRKHGEDRHGVASTWLVDPFSTGGLFGGWKELADKAVMGAMPEGYEPLIVYQPKTWLLAVGWMRIGTISARESPAASIRQRR